MPPKNVRTIRELIYWEYAKLVSGSATGDRRNYRFVMYTYQRLLAGKAHPSAILRENKHLFEEEHRCAYCPATEPLQWDHIIPKSRGGPESMDNMVQACSPCNLDKGARDPFEWYGLERRDELPSIVVGKYLKLVYESHSLHATLDLADLNHDGKLDIYDLGAVFRALSA